MNPLKNAALVSLAEDPWWYSTRSIRDGIIKSYKIVAPHLINVMRDYNGPLPGAVKKLREERISRLIFTESNPHPLRFVEEVLRAENSRSFVQEYCFHVQGNFTYYIDEWAKLLTLLKNKKVKIVVASSAQKRLVLSFFKECNEGLVDVCPFPVIPEQKSTKDFRRKYRYSKDDVLITYAGRISIEKNVDQIIEFSKQFLERHPKFADRTKIIIAGEFDNHGLHFLGRELREGEFFNRWDTWYKNLPFFIKKRVQFTGFLTRADLQSLYHTSDLLVSLSTFHDEDFGMVPLEALCEGCPALLTAWGGYIDFAANGRPGVALLPVKIDEEGISLDYNCFEKTLLSVYTGGRNPAQRRSIAKLFRNNYSLRTISQKYLLLHRMAFCEPQAKMRPYANAIPQYDVYSSEDPHYFRAYKGYLI